MRMRPLLCLCVIATVLITTGCPSRSNPPPVMATPAQVGSYVAAHPASSAERIEHGRQLILANCNRCHGYPARDEVDLDEWAQVVPRMCRKTKITATEHDQVLEYCQAVGKP